jgi:flagellar hook-associated protein 3 FlgL
MTDKYSNFLRTTGTDFGQIQHQALDQSLTELDELLDSLTTQITDFGARANRLQVQSRIYENLELSTAENLSEQQDTDMIEALMQLKAKEVAYQAALSAAAKTMQISLVDYL